MKIIIEDYYGNDLCSLEAYNDHRFEKTLIDLSTMKNCDVSDKGLDEDGNEYIRIQLTNPLIADKV